MRSLRFSVLYLIYNNILYHIVYLIFTVFKCEYLDIKILSTIYYKGLVGKLGWSQSVY